MVDPTKITVEEQANCIDKNSVHIIKSLQFAMKKLDEYYHGGAEMNGMSYRAFLGLYNSMNDTLETFNSMNKRITETVSKKGTSSSAVPRRHHQ
jgi:hypothetical protein